MYKNNTKKIGGGLDKGDLIGYSMGKKAKTQNKKNKNLKGEQENVTRNNKKG